MAKSLQEQLVSSGLAKKKKAREQRRAQQKAARGVTSAETEEARRLAQQEREEKAARDKALNAEKKAQAERKAIAAQISQLIQGHQVKVDNGQIGYRFTDGKKIKKLYVTGKIQEQLVRGVLAIVKEPDDKQQRYSLLPRAVAEKIAQRDESLVVVLNTHAPEQEDEDDPYAAFKVPDDLMW